MYEEKLKEMWKNAGNYAGVPGYESETIERFLNSRSNSVAGKISKMLQFDVALKLLVVLVLVVNAVLFVKIQLNVFYVCVAGIVLVAPLIWYEFIVLKRFSKVSDYAQNTREKLSGILTFLRSRFFTAVLSVASTYLFFFIAGSLVYFYAVYGKVRPLDNMDVFVFVVFCIIGIVVNFAANYGQVKYNIKHLETCLSEMNDNVFASVSQHIENQQKQDRTNKLLLGLVLVFGFVLLVFILKKIGF